MYEFLKNAISALPSVASSPLSLVGYVALLISWLAIALKVKRNKQLLQHLNKLPEGDRLKALEMEMGTIRVKGGMSPEQWLQARLHQYYFFGFGILCLVAVLVFAIASQRSHITKTRAQLQIVDANVAEQSDGFPVLEVKVRNVGDRVAFLKKAVLNVTDVFNLDDPYFYQETHVNVSWNYDVRLKLTDAPYSKVISLSQSVQANDVDRFTFTLGHGPKNGASLWPLPDLPLESSPAGSHSNARSVPKADSAIKSVSPERGESKSETKAQSANDDEDDEFPLFFDLSASIVRIQVELVYNEDNGTVKTEPILFLMPVPPHFVMAIATPKLNAKEIVAENKRKILAASKLPGTKTHATLKLFDQMR